MIKRRNQLKLLLILLFIFNGFIRAQTDWVKWEGTDVSYELPQEKGRSYRFDRASIGTLILTGTQNTYYFLVSDLDGDNCPFYPSCSIFFVQAVKETNFFQGLLIFADRFTRDTNLFKDKNKYIMHSSGRLYDPVENYILNSKNFKYISD